MCAGRTLTIKLQIKPGLSLPIALWRDKPRRIGSSCDNLLRRSSRCGVAMSCAEMRSLATRLVRHRPLHLMAAGHAKGSVPEVAL